MKSDLVCYLDLDGVLVDFTKGVLAFHKREDFPYKSLDWDFDKKLGLTPEQFWGGLGYDFWVGLDWTLEGKEILKLVESKFGDSIAIITSPPKTGGAVEGKMGWVKREIPKYARKTFVGARKELLASPRKILIDDREENILAFRQAGGLGILVPRPWNSNRKEEDRLVEHLGEELGKLL